MTLKGESLPKMLDTLSSDFILTKFVCLALITFLSWMGGAASVTVTTKFQIFQNKSPVTPALIQSAEGVSLVDCASMCTANALCKSFIVNCFKFSSTKQICDQQGTTVSSDLELATSDLCYIQKVEMPSTPVPTTTAPVTPAPTTPAPTTPVPTTAPATPAPTTPAPTTPAPTTTVTTTTTTTAQATSVIDIVYGPRDMCPGGSSSKDFLVLTPSGVYVYDEMDNLTSAPCDGPVAFTSIFKNYPSIPAIDMVSGILIYQTSNVELYADGTVYKWQVESGQLNSVLGSQSYSSHLGTTDLNNVDFIWAAHRLGSSAERHFYLGGDLFFLKSSQHGTREFTKAEQVPDMNGFDMNPWSEIPTDTVAVTGYGNEPIRDYALIDSSGNVYAYHLDHTLDNNNPTKLLTQQGQIQF